MLAASVGVMPPAQWLPQLILLNLGFLVLIIPFSISLLLALVLGILMTDYLPSKKQVSSQGLFQRFLPLQEEVWWLKLRSGARRVEECRPLADVEPSWPNYQYQGSIYIVQLILLSSEFTLLYLLGCRHTNSSGGMKNIKILMMINYKSLEKMCWHDSYVIINKILIFMFESRNFLFFSLYLRNLGTTFNLLVWYWGIFVYWKKSTGCFSTPETWV